jgi:hypothetical protein
MIDETAGGIEWLERCFRAERPDRNVEGSVEEEFPHAEGVMRFGSHQHQ